MLNLKNASRVFNKHRGGKVEAVRDISFEVKKGECIAIVGPSGCGKTTLLRMIAGLLPPTAGEVVFHERSIKNPGADRGVVFQRGSLFPWLTVKDNVAFGLRIQGKSEAEISSRVAHYLRVAGLVQFEDSYPASLSGGMQQRVAIARTLANDPEVVLLDEPFSALDVQTRGQMQDFLLRLFEDERRTTIIVTHDVDEAVYLADRVVLLSTKPGTVREIVDVDLHRPRRSEVRSSEQFLRMRNYIAYAIRAESIKATIDTGVPSSGMVKLRMGIHSWPGAALFYLAHELGIFARHSISIELVGMESDEDRLRAWNMGEIDVINSTLDGVILAAVDNPEVRVLCPIDYSAGGDALVASSRVHSIADLKGKRVGMERRFVVTEFFLSYLLERQGLSLKDVKLIDLKVSEVGSALIAERVDAGILWGPWLQKTKELAGANIIASSTECPYLFSVLMTKESIVQGKHEVLFRLKDAWRDAVSAYKGDKGMAIKIMAPYFGLSELEFAEEMDTLVLVDPDYSLKEPLFEIERVFLQEGLLKEKIRASALFAE